MPAHDWTRVSAGIFHHFHQRWIAAIGDALNGGLLPPDYFALSEQVTGAPIPDVVTLRAPSSAGPPSGGVAAAEAPPRARIMAKAGLITPRTNHVVIRHESGVVVCIIEIVSPGNKDSRSAVRAFVDKASEFLRQGVNLLVVDVLPPTPRDPQGIHKAIWDNLREEPFELPPGQPLTCAAYAVSAEITAYVEPFGVGEPLPEMPVFLGPGRYVPLGLEATYQATWAVFPAALKGLLTG
jgi:hypothetical protein